MSRNKEKKLQSGVIYDERLRQWIAQPQAKDPATEISANTAGYEMISIYRSKINGAFIIQPMARHPSGASGEFGTPTVISDDQFDIRIVPVVRENLRKYHQQAYQDDLAPKHSNKVWQDFLKEHLCVSVTRFPSGQTEIRPSHHERGGYVGDNKSISLSPDEIPEKLAAALREAFSQSS